MDDEAEDHDRQPPNFAEPPPAPRAVNRPHPDAPSDALSDVLHAIHLRGGTVSRHTTAAFTEATHPRGTRLLHIVERGDVDLRTNGSPEPIALGVGDLVLLARGDAHTLRAGEEGSWVTGTFVVEEAVADPFLAVLPAALVIHGSRDDDDWLPLSLALLVAEVQHPRPGSQVMVSRILDLLFIHALRVWAARGDTAPGWLTAAMDPALGPVLTAIHRNPAHDWTVDQLAQRANLSRSAFAGRFTRLLGQPPAAYVTQQRLDQAAHLLATTAQPAGKIAKDVGYTSDAAFSRAFHRRYGTPPHQWRRGAGPPPSRQTTSTSASEPSTPSGPSTPGGPDPAQ